MSIRSIGVFCGARVGNQPAFKEAAIQLAQEIVKRDCELVYGGGQVGLMGVVADEVLFQGGKVVGIIPEKLVDMEQAHQKITEMVIVKDLFERKRRLIERSDAFVSLPGGLGTFDEHLEVLTHAQLGYHDKPMGLLNVDGYYEPFVQQIEKAIEVGFISPEHRSKVAIQPNAEALLRKFFG